MYKQSADVAAELYDKPRKRIVTKNDTTNVEVNEADDEEDLGEILKRFKAEQKFNKYRTSDDPNAPPFVERMPRGYNGKWMNSQEQIYIGLIFVVIVFVMFISVYNVGQLERIKEKYGLDEIKSTPTEEVWWRTSHMYYVYVRSFKDSNSDGIGDINGIREKLDYLSYLGVETLLISPVFASPMVDCGDDVSDHFAVDPVYGDLLDYKSLVREVHAKGMKIIQEVVPNHTSRRHPWFQRGHQAEGNNYTDYYIWHEGRLLPDNTRAPPSNWISRFGGSAWTWDSLRGQFFYHYYHPTMPDLNHRNPMVRQHTKDMMSFWLDMDLDGLHMKDIHAILESPDLSLDEPENDDGTVKNGAYEYVDHSYTERQLEIHEFLAGWGELVDSYTAKRGRKIVLLLDVKAPLTDTMMYYNTGGDAPLCRHLYNMGVQTEEENSLSGPKGHHCGGRCVYESFDSFMTHMPDNKDALWMTASPEVGRIVQRHFGRTYSQLVTMATMLAPGAVVNYYGEEIGQEEVNIPADKVVDVYAKQHKTGSQGRDPGRAPLQWTREKWAGFTNASSSPWLPLDERFLEVNVESQMKTPGSQLLLYKKLSQLRLEPSFRRGKHQPAILTNNIFSFLRYARDAPPYFVAMNFGELEKTHDYSLSAGVQYADLVAHARDTGDTSTPKKPYNGDKPLQINLEKLTLKPGEGMVLKLSFDIDPSSNIL